MGGEYAPENTPHNWVDVNTSWRSLPDNKKPASLTVCGLFGLQWTSLNFELVEAAGIEPASASTPPKGLHACPALLI